MFIQYAIFFCPHPQAEGQLTTIKSEQERFRGDAEELIARLRSQVAELEKEKEELNTKLEDEQRWEQQHMSSGFHCSRLLKLFMTNSH